MPFRDLLPELRNLLHERSIEPGILLLQENLQDIDGLDPAQPDAGLAVGCLAQWVDVGFDDAGVLSRVLARFSKTARQNLALADYVHLRLAEALLAMRHEDLSEALRHLDSVLAVSNEVEDPRIAAIASLWKARCLRKAGEYDRALEITRHGVELARAMGSPKMAAVMRTLESWLLFQRGQTKEAVSILQESEAALRSTDDFITLGNIQSTYGRIALREGRYDHAMQYFEASLDIFRRRPSLEGYLARSLTNTAQAKRFAALQLRRVIDARRERQQGAKADRAAAQQKSAQLERMHELLRTAEEDLVKADSIYKRMDNHHGAGNVDVNLANIYLDRGDLDRAEERAAEALALASSKADHLLMCRARVVQAMVANARFEEQIGETGDPSRFAQLAHDCAKEAVDLGERTGSRRLRAQAYICQGLSLINGFYNNTEAARACCDRAEAYLDNDRQDALWQELEILRAKILHSGGVEDPNLRAWSQGATGGKSLQQVVADFEELVIRRVWENEERKVSRVAQRLAVSPKKVRRVLRHLGVIAG
jgi:tetratricopeptide (TPR) repeat protein